jgi:hypothetical protein
MPADRERHQVAAIAEQPGVRRNRAIAEEARQQQRRDQPRKQITRLHPAPERRGERLGAVAAVEDLVAVREVRVIDEVGDQQHRSRQRGGQLLFGQQKEQRQQQQRTPAEHQEIDRRTKQIARLEGGVRRGHRTSRLGLRKRVGHR